MSVFAHAEVASWAEPGFVLFVQAFGDLVNFHPHLHTLVADGCQPRRVFCAVSPDPDRAAVSPIAPCHAGLSGRGRGDRTGFCRQSVKLAPFQLFDPHKVRLAAVDAAGRQQLARHMSRNPFLLDMMTYRAAQGVVVYRSMMHASPKRNVQIMPLCSY